MGINVSHGEDFFGEERRSATTIANLGAYLRSVLTGDDWSRIQFLFDGAFADEIAVEPARAREIGNILHSAANHPRMKRQWAAEAAVFARAANRAADAGESWTWS
ncbi:hypothetical protein SLUN_19475 [Streptomyces lunaelactis]|uniref:DUF7739 domain-containing protein n=1 Tax=Streptomyces lunaelactis TaxID=1535768 RepID=A0A2R4T4G9_9ACTN|nr:hypothetical protein [Streptomyces lunaelactis]AVZ74018.1 hypothetical protein SLUN_19475 [Streptomyces lunaelactis]NUK85176.1 hypothetical protein [Streptomyces lunaelactis]